MTIAPVTSRRRGITSGGRSRGLHHRGHREHRARKEELTADSPEELNAKGLTPCGPRSNRWLVFYHPGDLNDAWQTGSAGISKSLANRAYQLGINVVAYSFNHKMAAEAEKGN